MLFEKVVILIQQEQELFFFRFRIRLRMSPFTCFVYKVHTYTRRDTIDYEIENTLTRIKKKQTKTLTNYVI